MNGAPELKTANHHATRALNGFCIIRNVEFSRFAQIVIANLLNQCGPSGVNASFQRSHVKITVI